MPRRSPWEPTTQSTPLTSVTASTTTITTSTNSYKRVTLPLFKYTQTTANDLYTDRYKYYNDNDSNRNVGGGTTTTRRSFSFFNLFNTVSTTPKVTNGPIISPFRYRNSVMSLSTTTTTGYQNGLRNNGRGKRIRSVFFTSSLFNFYTSPSISSRDESSSRFLHVICIGSTILRPIIFFVYVYVCARALLLFVETLPNSVHFLVEVFYCARNFFRDKRLVPSATAR